MQLKKYLYALRYDNIETELSKLESKYLFGRADKNKLLFSDLKIAPSNSAFIKSRLDLITSSKDYAALINNIEKENISKEDFKVEYIVYDGDATPYDQRLKKLKDIGYRIEGNSDYYNPTTTYALCYYEGTWCFGVLIKNKNTWHKHQQKPYSYSNSIGINIAKALVNIAAKGNKTHKLLDACCGVGTILLEACFAGHQIEGCDINRKVCNSARSNLAHFNYTANVYCSDIKDIIIWYDTAIIDLPYNLLSVATDGDILHIIASTAAITNRIVIVSISDISELIRQAGFKVADFCSVSKQGKRSFARKIWVCEKIA